MGDSEQKSVVDGDKSVEDRESSSTIQSSSPTVSETFLSSSGMFFIVSSIVAFGSIVYLQFGVKRASYGPAARWIDFLSDRSDTFILLVVGIICALLGLRLLTTTQNALARTIPKEDLPMIQAAVIAGKSDPIDQYVRLRSLAGWAGTFTKLGVTGLPLVTVILTLIFAFIALLPFPNAKDFLDLAKLTLGVHRIVRSEECRVAKAGCKFLR